MAWPIVTIAVKLLWLKFLKGAAVGVGRYIHRLFTKDHQASDGRKLEGRERISHVLRRETTAKDNVVFLLLMLGNFFFGLQELCLLLWNVVAKRLFTEFRTGMPAALEDAENLAARMHNLPWRRILPEMTRWLFIASLVYWPLPPPPRLRAELTRDPRWMEIRYGKHTYLVRTDIRGKHDRYGMAIEAGAGDMTVSAPGCEPIVLALPVAT